VPPRFAEPIYEKWVIPSGRLSYGTRPAIAADPVEGRNGLRRGRRIDPRKKHPRTPFQYNLERLGQRRGRTAAAASRRRGVPSRGFFPPFARLPKSLMAVIALREPLPRGPLQPEVWYEDQTCFGRNGGLAPINLPLFQGARMGAVEVHPYGRDVGTGKVWIGRRH
jgi:hypothetical protein